MKPSLTGHEEHSPNTSNKLANVSVMASSSMQAGATLNKSTLTPVMALEGHEPWSYSLPDHEHHEYKHISCISYFPNGKEMVSGSGDKTVRRWDLRKGKEIKEAREVCEYRVDAVGVSRDGRWIVSAGEGGIKVSEVETGIVRTFYEDDWIYCIDISADSTLLAGGSIKGKVRIWNLGTGELVAGPFNIGCVLGALRFSEDARKLAMMSKWGKCQLQVWDVQTQKLDVQKSTSKDLDSDLPVFWTTKDKSIVAAWKFTDKDPKMIYEFDPSTLKTVGAPFKHTSEINGLALSSDRILLASSSYRTINLWAFESRQLLASFDVESIFTFVLSPDSHQLAYTTFNDTKIHICNIPANILTSIESISKSKRSRHADLLNSDATCHTVRRKTAIIPMPRPPRPLPTSEPNTFLRSLRKLFSSSSRTDAVPINDSRNPLDFPATSPLPRPLINPDENSRPASAPRTTQSSAINPSQILNSSLHRLSTWWPLRTNHASPAIVDVPLAPGKLRIATAGAPSYDDDLIRDEEYVSHPPTPSPSSHAGVANTGQHGSGRFCCCF